MFSLLRVRNFTLVCLILSFWSSSRELLSTESAWFLVLWFCVLNIDRARSHGQGILDVYTVLFSQCGYNFCCVSAVRALSPVGGMLYTQCVLEYYSCCLFWPLTLICVHLADLGYMFICRRGESAFSWEIVQLDMRRSDISWCISFWPRSWPLGCGFWFGFYSRIFSRHFDTGE